MCISRRSPSGFEVAWSLWLAKNLTLRLSNQVGEIVSRIDDDIVALAALDLRDSGLLQINDVSLWTSHLYKDALYSEHWLLAYEACEHGWLRPPNGEDYIGSDDFFSILRKHRVLFYDAGAAWDEGYHEPGYSKDDDESEEGKRKNRKMMKWEIRPMSSEIYHSETTAPQGHHGRRIICTGLYTSGAWERRWRVKRYAVNNP